MNIRLNQVDIKEGKNLLIFFLILYPQNVFILKIFLLFVNTYFDETNKLRFLTYLPYMLFWLGKKYFAGAHPCTQSSSENGWASLPPSRLRSIRLANFMFTRLIFTWSKFERSSSDYLFERTFVRDFNLILTSLLKLLHQIFELKKKILFYSSLIKGRLIQ